MNSYYSAHISKLFFSLAIAIYLGLSTIGLGKAASDQTEVQAAVLNANDAFYKAFRSSDFATMDTIWARNTQVSVIHPRWPSITGRKQVMASWHNIMIKGKPPQIKALNPTVIISGKTAYVLCYEDLGGRVMVATNIFTVEKGTWRMIHHHASPAPITLAPKGQPT